MVRTRNSIWHNVVLRRLKFANKDEAVAYAKKQGYMYRIDEPRERPPPRKAYADNFRYTRVGPWTH